MRNAGTVQMTRTVDIHAPHAFSVDLHVLAGDGAGDGDGDVSTIGLTIGLIRNGDRWRGSVAAADGDLYWLVADGAGPLLDPSADDVVFSTAGPRCVFRTGWPSRQQGAPLSGPPVVYELHVRGFGRTFGGVAERLDDLVDLGVNVIELMPVHPFETSANYWGYMPVVWGAVHRGYAQGTDAAGELADLVAAAHERGMHVWLDVVFNHTGEGEAELPTLCLRGLDDTNAYRHHADGSYVNDSACGNDIDPADPEVRRLMIEALERYADLGIDGFRFDLASLLTRDGGGLAALITEWAERRGVVLIAEAWDMGSYQVGDAFPERSWAQWNDRFRDDVRGFLRAEPGLVPAMVQRVQGSPDLFGAQPSRSVNFVTAHDGLTMHDLTAVTSDRHRSWDCGPQLRLQQLKNFFTVLLVSAGTPMFVMGDEFGRTQHCHDNPYNIDDELTWVDWSRRDEWRDLRAYVQQLLRLRTALDESSVRCYGVNGAPDTSHESRSLAWCSGDLYVMVNAWWEPLRFVVQEPGEWQFVVASAPADGLTLAPRSSMVLRRTL